MSKGQRHSSELRERAVRMAFAHEKDHDSQRGASALSFHYLPLFPRLAAIHSSKGPEPVNADERRRVNN